MPPSNRDFFNQLAPEYSTSDPTMDKYARVVNSRLSASLAGNVLAVGGLWGSREDVTHDRWHVTVCDIAAEMLRKTGLHGQCVVGDAFHLPFRDQGFDHAVFAMVLHHLTGDSVSDARRLVRRAVAEVHRVVKRGGRVWIIDLCAPLPVYAAQIAVAPLTRAVLGRFGSSHILMHSSAFLVDALASSGWSDVRASTVLRARSSSTGKTAAYFVTMMASNASFLFTPAADHQHTQRHTRIA